MKFGKQLESLALDRFRGYYVQYKELKKAIKVYTGQEKNSHTVQEVTHWTSSFLRLGPSPEVLPEARLQEILARERDRVGKFCQLEEDVLRKKLDSLADDCQKGDHVWEELHQRLDELGDEIIQLKQFTQLNFSGFRKLLKKYDKWSKSNVTPWFMSEVTRSSMMAVDYEQLVTKLNQIAIALRQQAPPQVERQVSNDSLFGGQDERYIDWNPNTKHIVFLIDVKDTMRVKVVLAKYLAIRTTNAAREPSVQQSGRTTCTYFDTPNLSVYSSHVSNPTSGSLGSQSDPPHRPSFHVRHTDGEVVCLAYDAGGETARSDVLLARNDASRLLAGDVLSNATVPLSVSSSSVSLVGASEPAVGDDAKRALTEIQDMLQAGMQPVGQASYQRTVFKDGTSGLVVVLDEDVRMAHSKKWDAAGSFQSFPQDVLSISFSTDAVKTDAPKWLRKIYNGANMFQVSAFTKAVHALAQFRAKTRGLPIPHWYAWSMQIDAKAPADQSDSETERPSVAKVDSIGSQRENETSALFRELSSTYSKKAAQQPAMRLVHEFGSGQTNLGSGIGSGREGSGRPDMDPPALPHASASPAEATSNDLSMPLLVGSKQVPADVPETAGVFSRMLRRVKAIFSQSGLPQKAQALPTREAIVAVQPKTLYSNERTFLEWMHFATLMSALGIGALHAASTKTEVALGRFLIFAAIFLVVWSLHTFNWRAEALDNKEIREYADPVGPVVLMSALLIALTCSSLHAIGVLNLPESSAAGVPLAA